MPIVRATCLEYSIAGAISTIYRLFVTGSLGIFLSKRRHSLDMLNSMPDHYSRIFLLSHMRAFTSLAGHILGSHPGINGYFEMHISYDDASALDKQLDVFLQFETPKKNSRYLFDKLLHNDYRLNTGLFDPAGLKLLVALMEPEKTVRSIVDLFQKKGTEALYASPLEAANYYVERIRVLADFCRTTDQPYYYYDAELFQEEPDRLLGKLTDWLELDSPLTGRYQVVQPDGQGREGRLFQIHL